MIPQLNAMGTLPTTQPYDQWPWFYYGNENVTNIPNTNVIDWVLVELRMMKSTVQNSEMDSLISRQAGFVLKNGLVRGLDGSSLLQFNLSDTLGIYATVFHRNHLSIISNNPLNSNNGIFIYDFTDGETKVYGSVLGHINVAPGIWAMTGGDCNGDGQINNQDKMDVWKIQAGNSGYLAGDMDMNGQVENNDKIEIWNENVGHSSFVSLIVYPWQCGSLLHDKRNGQYYETVLIGNQCWMAENINIGDMINGVQNQSNNGIIEKYCYANYPENCDTFGGLYQWEEVMQYVTDTAMLGICPEDWHIPADEEWKQLEGEADNLYGYPDPEWNNIGWRGYDVGLNLKSVNGWNSGGNGSGIYNFLVLSGGGRNANGNFWNLGDGACFWTSTKSSSNLAYYREFSCGSDEVWRIGKIFDPGFSVRCIKDTESSSAISVDFTSDINSGYTPLTVNFTDLSTGDIISWQWIFEGGVPALFNGKNPPPVVYNAIGSFDVTLIISDGPAFDTLTRKDFVWTAGSCPEITSFSYGGKVYNTVWIGTQCWMKENLNIGTMIPSSQNMSNNGLIEKYCYDNVTANCDMFGGLYDWDEMMQYTTIPGAQGICQQGWHLPDDEEWKMLEGTMDSQFGYPDPEWDNTEWRGYDAGLNMKAVGWWNNATDKYGFSALPGGILTSSGSFLDIFESALFWSSTEDNTYKAWWRYLDNYYSGSFRRSLDISGISVRCVKDTATSAFSVNFNADFTSGGAPLTVNYTDLSTGNIQSWQWTFEGGSPGSANGQYPPPIIYLSSGKYEVTLVISDGTNQITVGSPGQGPFTEI